MRWCLPKLIVISVLLRFLDSACSPLETQARALCRFFFATFGALRAGFLEGFASSFFDSI